MLLEGLLGAVVLVEESEVLHPELVELILELLQAGRFGVWLLSRCRHDLGWCTSAFPSIKYWILFIKSKARCCNTGGGDRRGGGVDVLAGAGGESWRYLLAFAGKFTSPPKLHVRLV